MDSKIMKIHLLLTLTLLFSIVNAKPIAEENNNNNNSSTAELLEISSKETKSNNIHEVVGGEFVEVRRLLDEIRIESIKKHGVFSDQDPTGSIGRQMIRDRLTFDDGTEASINRQVSEDLFENDILLTLPQAEHILKEVKEAPSVYRRPRQANPTLNSFWEQITVPYVFQLSQTNVFWQNSIRNAHRHIEGLTCIRFRYYQSDAELRGKDYLQYFRGTGCWSEVGRTGGRQPVSIGYGCESIGIVAHETLHALGLWHEQSRTDRDGFIRINLNAIMPGTESNFEKRTPRTSDNMGQPYDLGSAMHYGSKAFSTDARTYTILTQDRAYQQTIGQRGGLSFKDAKMINIRYCSKNCSYQLDCDNGGYTDPLRCGQCRCPDGYTGMFCQQIPTSTTSACLSPGEVTAGQWPGTISTTFLSRSQSCFWKIYPQYPNQRVELHIKRLNFPCKDACLSYLEIKYRKDKIVTGARLCCDVPSTIYSDIGTDVLLILRTDDTMDPGFKGFELSYKTVDGSIRLPNMPQPATTPEVPEEVTTIVNTTPTPATTTTTTETSTESVTATTTQPATVLSSTTATTISTTENANSKTTLPSTTTTTGIVVGKNGWGEWTKWTACSATCGACGQRKRTRTCLDSSGQCIGSSSEHDRCAVNACPLPMQSTRCSGRLVMPCDLIKQLDFGTALNYDAIRHHNDNENNDAGNDVLMLVDSNIVVEEITQQMEGNQANDALLLTENNGQVLRRHRRHQWSGIGRGRRQLFCEKKFTYHCPTTLLTISMDYHFERAEASAAIADDDGGDGKGQQQLLPSADSQHRCCAGYTSAQGVCVKKSSNRF